MFSNTRRACATTSSPPTSSRALVDRDDAGHEQEPVRLDGVREVRDRLGLARRPEAHDAPAAPFVASRASACSRISVSDCRGVSASGSTRSSITAGRPAASAASKAAANSSVRSTATPCAPNARGQRGEVGVDEVGARDAARIVPLLMHPDRPVHAVVDDEDDDRGLVLHRRRELLPRHQEVAVARDRDDGSLRMQELRRDGGRHAVPHRPARRRELGRVLPELVEAVRPDREVAGAVREDRVRRQALAHDRHHLAHVELAGHRGMAEVVEVVGATLAGVGRPPGRIERRQRGERARERRPARRRSRAPARRRGRARRGRR